MVVTDLKFENSAKDKDKGSVSYIEIYRDYALQIKRGTVIIRIETEIQLVEISKTLLFINLLSIFTEMLLVNIKRLTELEVTFKNVCQLRNF